MKLTILKRWSSLLLLLLSLGITETKAQPTLTVLEEWTTQEGTQNLFYQSATVTDGSGNVYKTGATINASGNYDMITVKYDKFGVQQWIVQYAGAGAGDDTGARLKVDGSGNVFVVGSYYANSTDSSNSILIKYNSSGTQQWTATYDGGQGRGDAGTNLEIDAATGDIYVCGTTYTDATDEYDFLTLKYNSSGTQQWVRKWDNVNLWDGAHKISFRNGTVTVSGGTQVNTTKYDYATIQYSSAGVLGSSNLAGGSNPVGFNKITGMVTDASNNIYITGSVMNANYDCYTMKLDANLNQLWTATYNGSANLNDVANDIQVDASGNVYITGYTQTTLQGTDYVTIKYNSSGTQQWAVTKNGTDNKDDEAYALVLDNSGNVYVTGTSYTTTDLDFYTIKYDNSGNTKWGINFNSPSSKNDKATDICLDSNNDLIVAGQSGSSGDYKYTTVKYSEKTIVVPVDLNNEPPISSLWYYQNRGQLLTLNHTIATDVFFYNPDNRLFFKNTGFSYLFYKYDTAAVNDTVQRVDVSFSGGNTNSKVYPYEKGTDYLNFYNATYSENITRVESNKRLYIPDIYNNIDIQFYSNEMGFKYYFVVKPGGKPSDIVLSYSGQSSLSYNSSTGELSINHKGGSYTQIQPLAYEMDANGTVTSLSWQPSYSVSGSNVSFTTGTYNTTKNLIIEVKIGTPPTPSATLSNNIFSTYVGGNALCEVGQGLTAGNAGKIYSSGTIFSTFWPGAVGGYQTQKAQWQDAYLLVLNSGGGRVCGTYFGGNGYDAGTEIAIGKGDTVYFSGTTHGGYAFPITFPTGAFVDSTNTGTDYEFFVAKANPGLTNVVWATMIGGDQSEEETQWGTDMVVDSVNNELYIGGRVTNYNGPVSDFPVLAHTSNANAFYRSTYADGALMKFNTSTCQRIWGTYFPGVIEGMTVDVNGNFYIVGYTFTSPGTPQCATPTNGGFPLCGNSGFFQDTLGSNVDGFITKFDRNGNIKHSTYFGGSDIDEIKDIAYQNRRIFITGSTYSPNGNSNPTVCCGNNSLGEFPTYDPGLGATFQNSLAGNKDAFVAKLDTIFNMNWSTYYGGTGYEEVYSLEVDNGETVYIGGQVYGGTFLTNNPGNNYYYQSSNADGSGATKDAFITRFNNTNNVSWSSYFGGYNANQGYSCLEEGTFGIAVSGNYLWMTGVAYSTSGNVGHWPYRCDYPSIQFCRNTTNFVDLGDGFLAQFDLTGNTNDISEVPMQNNSYLFIYPNPSNSMITVRYNMDGFINPTIRIFNYLGQSVYNEQLGTGTGIHERAIDISSLSNGLYVIQLSDNKNQLSKKLIKE